MKNKKNIKAFTLVELIVTITILTILWTIAFTQYWNYWTDAKNTKKITDLSTFSHLIDAKSMEIESVLTFVWGNDENKINLNHISVWWKEANNDLYDAGLPNYIALWIKREEFIDPLWNDYRIWATSTYWWRYEIATFLVKDNKKTSYIKWNYIARSIKNINIEHSIWKVITLNSKDTNTFKSWDRVKFNDWTFAEIRNANRDWVSLQFNKDISGITSLELALDETKWLLASKDDNQTIVTNGSETNFVY